MRHHRTTIDEIAERIGLSATTVSNVFNNKGRFSESTRARVLKAAEELHFTPNALIRSLQQRRTNLIGVRIWPYYSESTSSISMYLIDGISRGLKAIQKDMLHYMEFERVTAVNRASLYLDGRVDGLIITAPYLSQSELQTLASSGLPAVVLYNGPTPLELGSMNIDNATGIRALIDHLYDLGHRRIAFYGSSDSFDMRERYAICGTRLKEHGIAIDPAFLYAANDYMTPVTEIAEKWFSLYAPPTAIVAGDDNLAIQWIRTLKARGLRIPEDVSITGFDDSSEARVSGLTTVRQPAREIGETAARYVQAILDGVPGEECHRTFPVELVVRGSTAPPRSSISS